MLWASGRHEGVQLAHASLNPDAVFDYLLTPRALKAHFAAQKAPLCFVGHTHVTEIWTEGRENPVAWPKSGVYRLEEGLKTVINVGSVGLPRGDDKRASCAVYDPLAGEVPEVLKTFFSTTSPPCSDLQPLKKKRAGFSRSRPWRAMRLRLRSGTIHRRCSGSHRTDR